MDLKVVNLTKHFGKKKVLKGLSFTLQEGELVGFLGPNGAGKTTTLRCLLGLYRIDQGEVFLGAYNQKTSLKALKERIGFVPEEGFLFPYLTGKEHLHISASLRKRSLSDYPWQKLARFLELDAVMDQPVATYSHGMRQKLQFLLAFYFQPEVLLIDEPMVGLDIPAQKKVQTLMRHFVDEGGSILLSTHQLSLVLSLATRVLVLSEGELTYNGPPEEESILACFG